MPHLPHLLPVEGEAGRDGGRLRGCEEPQLTFRGASPRQLPPDDIARRGAGLQIEQREFAAADGEECSRTARGGRLGELPGHLPRDQLRPGHGGHVGR